MQFSVEQRRSRVEEAEKLYPFLAAEFSQLTLAAALGNHVDPQRYARADQKLRYAEQTIDTNGNWQPDRIE